jgi:hypothetical protein
MLRYVGTYSVYLRMYTLCRGYILRIHVYMYAHRYLARSCVFADLAMLRKSHNVVPQLM